MSDEPFYSVFLNIHQSGALTELAWLVLHKTAAVSVQALCTPYNHADLHLIMLLYKGSNKEPDYRAHHTNNVGGALNTYR